MTPRSRKRTDLKVHKLNKRKSRKSKRSRKSTKSTKSRRGYCKRGGYGKGACPFVGKSWNATKPSYYYKHSPDGVGVGGIHPYAGNHSPSPQKGGMLLQPLVNLFRVGEIAGENVVNSYKGMKLKPSPLPTSDQLKNMKH